MLEILSAISLTETGRTVILCRQFVLEAWWQRFLPPPGWRRSVASATHWWRLSRFLSFSGESLQDSIWFLVCVVNLGPVILCLRRRMANCLIHNSFWRFQKAGYWGPSWFMYQLHLLLNCSGNELLMFLLSLFYIPLAPGSLRLW